MPTNTPKDYRKKRAPFEFAIGPGTSYKLRAPTFDEMKAARDAGDDIDGMVAIFAACGDEETTAAIRGLELPDVNELFADWIGSFAPDGESGKSGGSSR